MPNVTSPTGVVRIERSGFTCGTCSMLRAEPCYHYTWTMEAGKRRVCCSCWCARDSTPLGVQQANRHSLALR